MQRPAVFAAVLLTCSPVLADPPVVRISQDQQRKVCVNGQCHLETSTVWGSGVVIGRGPQGQALVASCGHGWRSGTVDIWFKKGDHRPGKIIAARTDGDVDISLMGFTHKGDIETCALADRAPSRGHALSAQGWGDGTLRSSCVDCEGYFGKSTLVVSGTFRQGDSGGPLVLDGRLVGIVTGNLDGHGAATGVKAIRQFVVNTIGFVPGPAEEVDAPLVPPPPEPIPATTKSELLVIMERLDRIERRIDLLSAPFPVKATR